MLFHYKLRGEKNSRVDDLLEEHEDVEGGAKVSLMPGLLHLLCVQDVGGRSKET